MSITDTLQTIFKKLLFSDIDGNLMLFLGVFCVFLVFIFMVFFSSSLKRLSRYYARAGNIPKNLEKENVWLKHIKTAINLFNSKGYQVADKLYVQIQGSFASMVSKLKSHFEGENDYMYKLPFYLIIGGEKSGKSTLLENLNVGSLIGHDANNPTAGCRWWFFTAAVIMETHGRIIETSAGGNVWQYILSMLGSVRNKRPLDGVIITVSVGDLLHNKTGSLRQAKEIYTKLLACQKKLGMKFPVYIIITKGDMLTGFSPLAKQLNSKLQENIFGWSNPYGYDVLYDSKWFNEWQLSQQKELNFLVDKIFADKPNFSLNSLIYSLKFDLNKLAGNLKEYLDVLFNLNKTVDCYSLRGIYFVGDKEGFSDLSVFVKPQNSDSFENEVNKDKLDLYDVLVYKGPQNKIDLAFVSDLFREKIFKEFALARPVPMMVRSYDKRLNYIRLGSFSFFGIWGVLMTSSYFSLIKYRDVAQPLVEQINQSLKGAWYLKQLDNNEELKLFLADQSQLVINKIARFNYSKSVFLGLPSSWGGGLHKDIRVAVKQAYEKVIIPSVGVNFIDKIESTLSTGVLSGIEKGNVQRKSFDVLLQFARSAYDLEKHIDIYNDMNSYGFVKAIGKIIYFLHDLKIPKGVLYDSDAYEKKFEVRFVPVDFKVYKPRFIKHLHVLIDQYSKFSFSTDLQFSFLTNIKKTFDDLSDSRKVSEMSQKDFLVLVKDIERNIDAMDQSEQLRMVITNSYEPGNEYQQLLKKIKETSIFGAKVSEDLAESIRKSLDSFISYASSLTSESTGLIFEERIVNGENSLKLTKYAADIIEALKNISQYDFIDSSNAQNKELPMLVEGMLLHINSSLIQEAVSMADVFSKYMDALKNIDAESLKKTLEDKGKSALALNLKTNLDRAFINKDRGESLSYGDIKKSISDFMQSLRQLQKIRSKVGKFLADSFFKNYFNLSHSYLNNQLQILNESFERHRLYDFDLIKLANWKPEGKPASYMLFNTNNPVVIKEKLDANRRDVERFSFLSQGILSYFSYYGQESMLDENTFYQKWLGIKQDLDRYKSGRDSVLKELEDFLTGDLLKYNKNYYIMPEFSDDSSNYFSIKFNNIKKALAIACKHVARKKIEHKYNEIAQFYNNKIAGKYPFSRHKGREEARMSDITKLFFLLDKVDKGELNFLKAMSAENNEVKEAYGFLNAIDRIKKVLPYNKVGKGDTSKEKKVKFKIKFRVPHADSRGIKNIADQILKSDRFSIHMRSHSHEGVIYPNDKIKFEVRWAKDGPVLPSINTEVAKNPKGARLITNNKIAIFEFSEYGLFTMLRDHSVNEGADGYSLLKFQVPTDILDDKGKRKHYQIAIFYVKIKIISEKTGKAHDLSKLITDIPQVAPMFPDSF